MSGPGARELRTLAQADLLLLIARLLDRPGDSTLEAVDATDADLEALAGCAGLGSASAYASLAGAVHDAREADLTHWGDEHSRLFEGAVVCPTNETAYVRRDKGAILADICGFYDAFGYRLSSDSGEKADHLITELEFLSLLLVMLAQARERGNADDEQVTLLALRAFASEHLDEWLALFCERLQTASSLTLYHHVATALELAAEVVFADHDVPRSEGQLADFPADEPGTPYECGMAAGDGRAELLDITDAPR